MATAHHRGRRTRKVQRDNEKSLEDFQNAIVSAVRGSSVDALNRCKRSMLEEAVRQATFNNYSGTLIRSYLSTVVVPRPIEEYTPKKAPKDRITKGIGMTEIYNKSANLVRKMSTGFGSGRLGEIMSSSVLGIRKLGSAFMHAKDIGGGLFLKKLTYIRSHRKPKSVISQYDTREVGEEDSPEMFTQYEGKKHLLSKMHGAVNADYVVLTNGAPYAEEVHRKWNRVLPGELPEYTKNFYLKRLRKTIMEMAKK